MQNYAKYLLVLCHKYELPSGTSSGRGTRRCTPARAHTYTHTQCTVSKLIRVEIFWPTQLSCHASRLTAAHNDSVAIVLGLGSISSLDR